MSAVSGEPLKNSGRTFLIIILWLGVVSGFVSESAAGSQDNAVYRYARQRVEETGRKKTTEMPVWLKNNRNLVHDSLATQARKSYEETGIWFLARGAGRDKDEQETSAVWGNMLYFRDLESLPGYTRENHQQAIRFWQSWQNLETGRLYNPLYQDPQNPAVKRETPGNRDDYSPDEINVKYVPHILGLLGSELPEPVITTTHADSDEDTFDELWKWIPQWATSPAGAFPVVEARKVDEGKLDRIPQVEAGMSALIRAYHRDTGMWRPEPLEGFPWHDYQPSSGFKIIARLCGYVGLENYPEEVLKTAIDNLLEHKNELYATVATARNYGETMSHYMMLTDYRHDELLDAMELCLEGFRDPKVWEDTSTSTYCVFGSGLIGAFMNWEDLPFDQALQQWMRYEHGCTMKWRFVVGPYENWVNVIPKEPEAVFGHEDYDYARDGLKARNRRHWAKKVTPFIPQREAALRIDGESNTGEGAMKFVLTEAQTADLKSPYLSATWNGAFDISLNGVSVKKVRYNLPDARAGFYIPESAARTLHAGENTVTIKWLGPGKDQKPGAPLSSAPPFIRLGLIDWR